MVSFMDLIFLTILVAFIITRLYTVFGSHSENKNVQVILRPINKKDEKKIVESIAQAVKNENNIENVVNIAVSSESGKKASVPADFDKKNFLRGACRVFEMVFQAFVSGNIESIKGLVSKKVWNALNQTILFRKENEITSEVDFICFEKSEVKDVKMLKNSARVVVEFVSQQVNILKNKKGEVIEGDENFVQKITDVWTFERPLNAKNSNWILVSTKKTL